MNGLQGITTAEIARLLQRAAAERVARRGPASGGSSRELPVSKPVGESGASVRSVGLHNSFLRMFMVETSHLPAQTRQVGGYHRVTGQDVSFQVTVLPGGAPMAVAGRARTEARDAQGARQALEELAYVSVLRRLSTGLAPTAWGAGTQSAPPTVRTTDSLLSALQVIRDRRLLGRTAADPLAGLLRAYSPGALRPVISALGRVAASLAGLEEPFSPLAEAASFTDVTASSSAPLFLGASAAPGAPAGVYRVEVLAAARGHSAESDALAPGPLGLSGSFRLNGIEVQVAAGDALFDLVARINYGEDADRDGQLDAGEDANGNYRLDGGSAAHGVRASFFADRLQLRSLTPAAGRVQVEDSDGVLRAIGLVELDERGGYIFSQELTAPGPAVIRVDGQELVSATGVFSDAAPGVELAVRGRPKGAVTVRVAADTSESVGRVRAALESFNAAIAGMNGLLDSAGGLLARDPAATRVRAGLVGAVLAPVAGQPEDLDQAGEAGIERAARRRTAISEEQLGAHAHRRRMGLAPPLTARLQSPPSVYNLLEELGITAAEDDTLELDEARLSAVLAARPAEVGGLFAGASGGIAARVLARLGTALGPSGLLELRRRAVEAVLAGRFGQKFARGLGSARRTDYLTAILPGAQG